MKGMAEHLFLIKLHSTFLQLLSLFSKIWWVIGPIQRGCWAETFNFLHRVISWVFPSLSHTYSFKLLTFSFILFTFEETHFSQTHFSHNYKTKIWRFSKLNASFFLLFVEGCFSSDGNNTTKTYLFSFEIFRNMSIWFLTSLAFQFCVKYVFDILYYIFL